jgi:hypothetical protein
MRPSSAPTDLRSMLAATYEVDHHRLEERRHAHRRSLLEGRVERPSPAARLVAAILRIVRRDRESLTDYPCRLPDGNIGRTAFVEVAGAWVLVCHVT